MTTFNLGGSAVTFDTSGTAATFSIVPTSVTFAVSGAAGTNGTNGTGVPTGGTANQVLAKIDSTNYNTQWVTPSAGGGASGTAPATRYSYGGADPILSLGSVVHYNQQTFAAGSAAGPSIAAFGDTNTGLYFPAADSVALATAGTARLTVNGTAVSIGTVVVDTTGAASGNVLTYDGTKFAPAAPSGGAPSAHASSHGAGGSDPITTLGTVTTTLGTVTTLVATNTATFGSAISIALGNPASPTLRFTGDTNTGLYSPGADQVALVTAGTARLTVNGTAVSIGTVVVDTAGAASGNVLTYNGTKFAPAAPSGGGGGGLVLVNSGTISAAGSLTVSSFSSTYDDYRIILRLTASTDVILKARLSVSSTASTTGYKCTRAYWGTAAGTDEDQQGTDEWMWATASNGYPSFHIFDLASVAIAEATFYTGSARSYYSGRYSMFMSGDHDVTTAYDAVVITPDTGTISGRWALFGYEK
jgi:hypothetical protein